MVPNERINLMSHPVNKRERHLIGVKKSKKRIGNFLTYRYRNNRPDLILKWERRHRNTSKTCSCSMCGNPRKFFNEPTMQEKRFKEMVKLTEHIIK